MESSCDASEEVPVFRPRRCLKGERARCTFIQCRGWRVSKRERCENGKVTKKPKTKEEAIATLKACEGYANVVLHEDESGILCGTHPNGLPARIAGSDKIGWFEVHGGICWQWLDRGGPTGELGLPVSNEEPDPDYRDKNGKCSRFQHGTIHGWPVDSGQPKGAWAFATETSIVNPSHEKANALCRYAMELAQRCPDISESDKQRIKGESQIIMKRIQNPNLHLGVIGEFSTGKSTFINAFLGMELLREDILQGTTCAPTLLSSGSEFSVRVEFSNGRQSASHPNSSAHDSEKWSVGDDREHALECVRKAAVFLHKYTADEEHSKDVRLVRISIPSDCWHLPDDVVIVDTPGLNSDNPRHGEVTRQAVHDICDLCCVLTSATIPCPSSLTGFLSENLREDSGRCVGVVTQIDRIRKRERDGTVRYVAERLGSEGLPFRDVVGVSPLAVVHPEEAGAEGETLRMEFEAFTKRLSELLREGRDAAIVGKVTRLARHLAEQTLLPILSEKQNELSERKDQLEANQLSNPESFFAKAEKRIDRLLTDEFKRSALNSQTAISNAIDKAQENIAHTIAIASSVDDLKSAVSDESAFDVVDKCWNDKCKSAITNGINEARQFLEGFHKEFNEAFRNLSSRKVELKTINVNIAGTAASINLNSVANAIVMKASQLEDSATTGGVVATIGLTILLGPIGLLLGPLGGWLYWKLHKDEIKGKALSNFYANMMVFRSKISAQLDQELLKGKDAVRSSVCQQLDRYRAHVPEILAIIEAERAEQSRIKKTIADIEKDMKMLRSYL